MASGVLDLSKNQQDATINPNFSGRFYYTAVGHICVGCGTLTATSNVPAYSDLVTNLPETVDGQSYMGAFITDDNGYNKYYVSGTKIVNREAIPNGTLRRILCVYMCK